MRNPKTVAPSSFSGGLKMLMLRTSRRRNAKLIDPVQISPTHFSKSYELLTIDAPASSKQGMMVES